MEGPWMQECFIQICHNPAGANIQNGYKWLSVTDAGINVRLHYQNVKWESIWMREKYKNSASKNYLLAVQEKSKIYQFNTSRNRSTESINHLYDENNINSSSSRNKKDSKNHNSNNKHESKSNCINNNHNKRQSQNNNTVSSDRPNFNKKNPQLIRWTIGPLTRMKKKKSLATAEKQWQQQYNNQLQSDSRKTTRAPIKPQSWNQL